MFFLNFGLSDSGNSPSILNAFPPTLRSPSSLIFAPKTQRFVGEVSIVQLQRVHALTHPASQQK
jgi:hypothetical protein